jgi:exodeoxyribonuclease VII large subunit
MPGLDTSPERPAPVRVVAQRIAAWINRLGEIWVEGQVAQLTRRPGVPTHFLTLRDTDANISMAMTCPRSVLPEEVREGARIVALARPDFYVERGTLSLRALQIRQVGLGELLARLDALRRLLAAEGLFAGDRKRRLPFLPRCVGLISGRASAAEHDVVETARRRFPATTFRIENVAIQGTAAVSEVVAALRRLDTDPEVDVIVVARGGGSVEDLLPFSNETLLRAVAACRTPVVSAIGHESDQPLLDLVADVAASTPTDAGRRVVPDLAEEQRYVADLRSRSHAAVRRRLDVESDAMDSLPLRLRSSVRARFEHASHETIALHDRAERRMSALLSAAHGDVQHVTLRLATLSPRSTVQRGYAIVQREDGIVVRAPEQATGTLRVLVADGEFAAIRVPRRSKAPETARRVEAEAP